jgi:cystathionine beta-lyase/cystathionine gamma-synthase
LTPNIPAAGINPTQLFFRACDPSVAACELDRAVYIRYGNPTVAETERAIAAMEHPDRAFAALTASGMAAIDVALSAFQTPDAGRGRPWLFPSELYGGTLHFVTEILRGSRGVPAVFIDVDAVPAERLTEHFVAKIRELRPPVVFIEPISNPRLFVLDIAAVAEAAQLVGSILIVDNTFATPLLVKPLMLGAHLVVHSATKYLAGHGNITAGVVCGLTGALLPAHVPRRGTDGTIEARIRAHIKGAGPVLSPRDAFELGTQLKTFTLRVRASNANAARLASLFVAYPKIEQVLYPGLPDSPSHATALRNFGNSGCFGAVVTVELAETGSAERLMHALEPAGIRCRLTLGDTETTLFAVKEVFGAERFGNHPEMLRVSVGIESWEDLEEAFSHGLSQT